VVCADCTGLEERTAKEIGDAAVPIRTDVSKSRDVERMIDCAEETFGRLDVVFNNAGIAGAKVLITEQTEENFDQVVAVNLKGVFLGMKFGIAALLRHDGGSVINTASAAGLVGWKANSVYSATKGGVVQITRSAALDVADLGVRVNAICPGMTWTGLVAASKKHPLPPADARPPLSVPMARWGVPGDIASAALFLASDESSFITGTALPVDGGYVVG
jgi:NAD(P)-dependent dehydrogenase (short-subunit alcohol dehydrogenase family)